ncbi:hypothetical protein WG66_011918 [Moniliophthora roreri]|nr:hypothetical protein WG66_011918 [Moniliophthora roreri]
MAIALARLLELPAADSAQAFNKTQQLALCSLLAFMASATTIGRVGDILGTHKRYWLIFGSALSCLFTFAGTIAIWQSHSGAIASNRGNPAWNDCLTFVGIGFMSASVGIQGVQAKRLNTQFTTTIVFTIVWMDVLTDRNLFNLRKRFVARDHRLISAGALFLGTFASRAILFKIGSAGALGVACGLRFLIVVSWLFIPAKAPEKTVDQK